MKVVFSLILIAALSFPVCPTWAEQEVTSERNHQLSEFADRYGFENWPGKFGSVVAGVKLDEIVTRDIPLVTDGERWLELNGEWVLNRRFATKDGRITLEVAVARSCRTAHELLFEHLASRKSMKALDPPSLPYGRIRLDDYGDVCFALPQHGEEEFHSIEFVRNNVVVRIRGVERGDAGLSELAGTIDRAILSRTLFRDWRDSNLWPSIDKFAGSSSPVKTRSIIPLLVSITDPGNEPYTLSWELSAGGVLEEVGKTYYYAEDSGPQALTLLVVNRCGLAAYATIELQVTE